MINPLATIYVGVDIGLDKNPRSRLRFSTMTERTFLRKSNTAAVNCVEATESTTAALEVCSVVTNFLSAEWGVD